MVYIPNNNNIRPATAMETLAPVFKIDNFKHNANTIIRKFCI